MLVPPLLALLGSAAADIRRRALSVLNDMFGQMPAGFQAALPQYTDVSDSSS
jgi:HEAT repeat protein